jgi:hypothetical protein
MHTALTHELLLLRVGPSSQRPAMPVDVSVHQMFVQRSNLKVETRNLFVMKPFLFSSCRGTHSGLFVMRVVNQHWVELLHVGNRPVLGGKWNDHIAEFLLMLPRPGCNSDPRSSMTVRPTERATKENHILLHRETSVFECGMQKSYAIRSTYNALYSRLPWTRHSDF